MNTFKVIAWVSLFITALAGAYISHTLIKRWNEEKDKEDTPDNEDKE